MPLCVLMLLIAPSLSAAERLGVTVSILPQKILVERIGGNHVDVSVMVRPGQSPATFEPSPRQMTALADADLYYQIGVPFEQIWIDRILNAHPDLRLLDARDGIQLRQMEPAGGHPHDFDHSHTQGEPDPHIWLSPPLIKIMALRLRDRLVRLDPLHKTKYLENHARLDRSLDSLDADIKKRLAGLKSRVFMVFHPSWGYFADAYELRQIQIESEGKEPGARTLALLIEEAKKLGIHTIFVQKQFSQAQAKTLARAISGKVVAIDPLAEDYPENLRRVADAIFNSHQNR